MYVQQTAVQVLQSCRVLLIVCTININTYERRYRSSMGTVVRIHINSTYQVQQCTVVRLELWVYCCSVWYHRLDYLVFSCLLGLRVVSGYGVQLVYCLVSPGSSMREKLGVVFGNCDNRFLCRHHPCHHHDQSTTLSIPILLYYCRLFSYRR